MLLVYSWVLHQELGSKGKHRALICCLGVIGTGRGEGRGQGLPAFTFDEPPLMATPIVSWVLQHGVGCEGQGLKVICWVGVCGMGYARGKTDGHNG